MTKKQRALEVIERLKKEYPDAGCTLDYDQAWKLLVSVRLAAQCTDATNNSSIPMCYINRFFFVRKEVEKKKQDFVKSCFFDNNFSTLTVQIDDAIKNIFLFSFLQKPDD